MNINIWTFLQQCAALTVWVFLVAAVYAVIERLIDRYYPELLAIEEAGASQAPMTMPETDPARPV